MYTSNLKSRRNMNKITLKTTGTQSSIYFGQSRVSIKWPEKLKYRAFNGHFKLVHFIFQQCSNLNFLKHWIFNKIDKSSSAMAAKK